MNEKNDFLEKEYRLLVPLFLNNHYNYSKISEITGLSTSTIQRRLSDRNKIIYYFDESTYSKIERIRRENKEDGKKMGHQIASLNRNVETPKTLDIFFKKESTKLTFLIHMMLTFKAKIDVVCSVFGGNPDSLSETIMNDDRYRDAFKFWNYTDVVNQDLAKEQMVNFYNEMLLAKKHNDLNKLHDLINSVTDHDAKELQARIKNRDLGHISDDDFRIMVLYHLKHACYSSDIEFLFNINRAHYNKRAVKYLENYPELKAQYDALSEFHTDLFKYNNGPKRT